MQLLLFALSIAGSSGREGSCSVLPAVRVAGMEMMERSPIERVQSGEVESVKDMLAVETDIAIEVRGETLIRTTCSPGQLQEWVHGYLLSEGRIMSASDVARIREVTGGVSVELTASAPSGLTPLAPVVSELTVKRGRLLAVGREVAERADVFNRTGGTHAMAIVSETEIVAFVEDISRTCALEKALGLALAQNVVFRRSLAFLSSRVPSRMIAKLARCGLPIVAAVSAPTAEAVRLAEALNVCVCGFVRDERLNVYAHGWRVGL